MYVCMHDNNIIIKKTTTQKLKASNNNNKAAYNKTRERDKFQSETEKWTGRRLRRERASAQREEEHWADKERLATTIGHTHIPTGRTTTRPTFCFYYRAQQSRLLLAVVVFCRRLINEKIIIIRNVARIYLSPSLSFWHSVFLIETRRKWQTKNKKRKKATRNK